MQGQTDLYMFPYDTLNFYEGTLNFLIKLMDNYEVLPFSMRLSVTSYHYTEGLYDLLHLYIYHNLIP